MLNFSKSIYQLSRAQAERHGAEENISMAKNQDHQRSKLPENRVLNFFTPESFGNLVKSRAHFSE